MMNNRFSYNASFYTTHYYIVCFYRSTFRNVHFVHMCSSVNGIIFLRSIACRAVVLITGYDSVHNSLILCLNIYSGLTFHRPTAPRSGPRFHFLFYGPRPKLFFRSPNVLKLLFHSSELSKLLFGGPVGRKQFFYFCIVKDLNFSV